MPSRRERAAVRARTVHASGLRYLPWHPIAGASDDPPPANDPPKDPPKDPPPPEEKLFTKAQIETATRDAIARERQRTEAETKKALEAAETKKLQEQQEYQTLAAKHEARVKELEPQAAQAERYEAALKAHLETQRKDLAPHLVELLDQMDVAAQLEWIAKHQDVIHADPPAGKPGVPATPKPAGTPTQAQVVADAYEKARAGGYRSF